MRIRPVARAARERIQCVVRAVAVEREHRARSERPAPAGRAREVSVQIHGQIRLRVAPIERSARNGLQDAFRTRRAGHGDIGHVG